MNLLCDNTVVDGVPGGQSEFLGVHLSQNHNAILAFNKLFGWLRANRQIGQIIELGTGHGGLTVFLQVFALAYKCRLVTYGTRPYAQPILTRLGVDFRLGSIWDREDEIAALIRQPGGTILLCDGRDKPREFRTFAQYLKEGDVIMAHDYAPNKEYWEQAMRGRVWNWREITDEHIDDVCAREGLRPYLQGTFIQAAWCCRRKITKKSERDG